MLGLGVDWEVGGAASSRGECEGDIDACLLARVGSGRWVWLYRVRFRTPFLFVCYPAVCIALSL